MGLDQYWFASKTKEEKVEAVLLNQEPNEFVIDIGYHRKWWELNDLMSQWFDGDAEDMNCRNIPVTEEMIDVIHQWAYDYITDLKGYEDEWTREEDAQKLVKWTDDMKQALAQGREVFYHPWW